MLSLTKASSVACVLLACLTFSSIVQAYPVSTSDKETLSRSLDSRSPDPRMIPDSENRDLVNSLFNSLGFSALANLNHWKSDNEPDVIDDSNVPTRTETTKDNTVDDNGDIHTDNSREDKTDSDDDKDSDDSKDKEDDKDSSDKDSKNDTQLPNPATDPAGFVTALMQQIQHTFNEALDSSDEHTLN
ncbi:hypothetical protein BO94DRAFT_120351 [Aspergillus sclerotioniger CBS 115572]|uniref:Uncharacterized protein n=1 Tax=Aspergillus sclerotioniger CBS 115572 TaxID=1450535 RepID=A0A317WG63_9EURO|nr:hypothetical protein BO94DRAFT_120351 [Aspergillus sclerotioniger CBS 115572]PWY83170.1 hypothetical protein BO94DRAFT_120351 [Aspergillus sclerotioniger CBS 115572]